MASQSASTAALRVFALPELMDMILSYASFPDVASAMGVCREWHDMIKSNAVLRARLFLTPHLTNKDGAFMVLWQEEKSYPPPGPLKFDTFNAIYGDATAEWNGITTPQLHPPVAHAQRCLKFPAFDGYPGFSVCFFDSKIQDPRFIKDIREGTLPSMQLSHPSTLAIYLYDEECDDYPYDRYIAYPDPVDLEVYEKVLKDHLDDVDGDHEMQAALFVPDEKGYVTKMNEREEARMFELEAMNGDKEDGSQNDHGAESEDAGAEDESGPDMHEVTKLLLHLGFWELE